MFNKKWMYIINYIIFCVFCVTPVSLERQRSILKNIKLNSYSDVILTIKGKNTQRILNNETFNMYYNNLDTYKNLVFGIKPSEIYINDIKQTYTDFFVYNLEQDINEIRIRFNDNLQHCNVMFYEMENILKIKFENFDTSELESIDFMFTECSNLISLDLSNFDTSSIKYMHKLFYYCGNLVSLDLSNFKTSSVEYMSYMFYSCKNLTSLDVSSFDTSNVISMEYMFAYCSKIETFDLNNFRTPSLQKTQGMFESCTKLISIGLSNFDTSHCGNMNGMFRSCSSLISIDLSTFNTKDATNILSMFANCNSNLVFCIDPTSSLTSNLYSSITSSSDYTFKNNNDCDHTCFYDNKKIILETQTCVENCIEPYIYEFKDICYRGCPEGTHIDSDNKCIKDTLDNSENNLISSNINEISTYINTNSEILSDSITTIPTPIDILTTQILEDKTDIITTNIAEITEGKSNDNDKIISTVINSDIITNDNDKIISTVINSDIITSNIIETTEENSKETVKIEYSDNSNIKDEDKFHFSEFYNFTEYLTYIIDINNSSDIVEYIKYQLFKGYLDKYISDTIEKQHKDLTFKEKNDSNVTCTLTSTYNQEINKNNKNNLSTIDLGLCESKLKSLHNISDNESLLILKAEIYEEGYLIPVIEYEVYNQKKKISLDICENLKVDVNIPVKVDENNLFKYNSSHDYYNDKCYPYTTGFKTDIIIDDRREEYFSNHMAVCERNCSYEEYNNDTKKVLCQCFIKIKFPIISQIIINKEILIHNFVDLKSTINLGVMKCYNQLFNIDGLLYNIGHYIISSFIIITILLCISFRIKGYFIIKSMVYGINKNKNKASKANKAIKYKKGKKDNKKSNNFKKLKIKKVGIHGNKIKKDNFIKKVKKPTNLKKIKNSRKIKINIMKTSGDTINKDSKHLILKNSINILENKNININILNNNHKKKIQNKLKKDIKLNDYEMNDLSYNNALLLDKRGYWELYFSLLRMKHLLIFTFYTSSDYNSKIIKITLFFFSFALFYTINTLFFTDSTMHKFYESQGNFKLIYQIPQILYSTLITTPINKIINYFSLSEKDILKFKSEKKDIKGKRAVLLNLLLFKFVTFFILIFLFLLLFWYYLSCFCAVYRNTQIQVIKDVIISFGLSLVYPLGINLLPGIFRIPSLRNKNKDKAIMYQISKIIQLI